MTHNTFIFVDSAVVFPYRHVLCLFQFSLTYSTCTKIVKSVPNRLNERTPWKDAVISQQMSTTVMSTGRPFTKLIKDSASSFIQKRVLPKHWRPFLTFGTLWGFGLASLSRGTLHRMNTEVKPLKCYIFVSFSWKRFVRIILWLTVYWD